MRTTSVRHRNQLGFSLVEMLVVILVLSILMAVVVQAINVAQARSATEQKKLDQFQEARELMDQLTRDLHQAGYPNARLLSNPVTANSVNNAVGLVKIAPDEIWFEGDVDSNGTVESVHYQLVATGPGCPCVQRLEAQKQATAPLSQGATSTSYIAVQRVLNGTSADPIFTAFKADGTAFTFPLDFNNANIADVVSVGVSLKVQGTIPDVQTKLLPQTNLNGTIRLRNCSAAAIKMSMSCFSS